jgi:biotin transport system substrate-specific component
MSVTTDMPAVPVRSAAASAGREASSIVRAAFEVGGAVVLMALAAQVALPVPGTPVPMTLQSLAALLCGLWLSPRRAVVAMLAYLACGSVYGPFFAGGSAGLMGYSGGYLVGFVVCAWLVAVLRGRGDAASPARLVAACVVGSLALFALGVVWQSAWLGGNLVVAVQRGFLPFALKDVVQIAGAVALVCGVRGLRRRRPLVDGSAA